MVIYSGMNMDMVRPNRSSVYFLDRRAMVSRYGSAAGESRAMKSLTSQRLLASARRTSVSFIREIRSVVSSQLIFSNSSENIFFLSIYNRHNGRGMRHMESGIPQSVIALV